LLVITRSISGSAVTTVTATASATTASSTSAVATSATGSVTVLSLLALSVAFELVSVSGEEGRKVISLGPKVGGQELVGLGESLVHGLNEVFASSGVTSGGGIAIIDTSEHQEFLGNGSTDNTSTSGGRDELASDGTALTGNLTWDSMDITDLVTPETSSNGDQRKLSDNKGTLDGDLNFLSDLDTKTNVTVVVTDGNDSLETSSLTGSSLLLDGDDLHNLIGELNFLTVLTSLLDKHVNDLSLLDGDGVGVDLLKRVDVTVLDESTELGNGSPFVLLGTTLAGSDGFRKLDASLHLPSSSLRGDIMNASTAESQRLLLALFAQCAPLQHDARPHLQYRSLSQEAYRTLHY
jgi:hypothetical protein